MIRQGKLNFSQSITSVPLRGDFDDIKEREIRSILNEFIKMIVSNATQDDIKTMKYFFLEIKADASSMDVTDVFESVLKNCHIQSILIYRSYQKKMIRTVCLEIYVYNLHSL